MSKQNIGKVVQVIGPVLDIRFEDGQLPELLNAIEIQSGDRKIVAEVAQHIGDNVARCISMNATDGMVRGLDAVDTGSPITVPVGDKCLGRIFNLLGQAIDDWDNYVATLNSLGLEDVLAEANEDYAELSAQMEEYLAAHGEA